MRSLVLARFYQDGTGVPKDDLQAVRWWRLAAEQDQPYAQINLGILYYCGGAVVQNYAEAAKWYGMAAEQGYPIFPK